MSLYALVQYAKGLAEERRDIMEERRGIMAGININEAYNHFATTYVAKENANVDKHKKSDLQNVYKSIAKIKKESPLLKYTREGDYVYFVHSFSAVECEESLLATVEYGEEITACVGKDNVFGCQFHPEKSSNTGLQILRAFCETEGIA